MIEFNIENNILISCNTDLESIEIPCNITEIKEFAFKGNKTIKKLIMTDNVKVIGKECFL